MCVFVLGRDGGGGGVKGGGGGYGGGCTLLLKLKKFNETKQKKKKGGNERHGSILNHTFMNGLTCEFFKFFWYEIGTFITRAINYSKEVMHFSEPNKLGIITCIPKGKIKKLASNMPFKCCIYFFVSSV